MYILDDSFLNVSIKVYLKKKNSYNYYISHFLIARVVPKKTYYKPITYK